jgi:hypothetical protein
MGATGILAFGEQSHGIATGEDAHQALLPVSDENRSAPTFPHAAARFPDGRVAGEYQRLLVFDNVSQLSIGHDA